MFIEALFTSSLLVAVAEIGDKTQLLSLLLSARFRKPWPIIGGILLATLLNHALAASLGKLVGEQVDSVWLQWGLALSFIIIGLWTLIPDKLEDQGEAGRPWGAFLTSAVAFFIAEMGDKTQIATLALGAEYAASLAAVVLGTTLGMLAANVPAVFWGAKLLAKLPLHRVRQLAAVLFIGFGVVGLLQRM